MDVILANALRQLRDAAGLVHPAFVTVLWDPERGPIQQLTPAQKEAVNALMHGLEEAEDALACFDRQRRDEADKIESVEI